MRNPSFFAPESTGIKIFLRNFQKPPKNPYKSASKIHIGEEQKKYAPRSLTIEYRYSRYVTDAARECKPHKRTTAVI